MKAVEVTRPGEAGITEKECSAAGADEVRVLVRRAGICGSDIHIFHGSNPFTVYPRVIGHEIAGIDAATGEKVVVDPVLNCGVCEACKSGHPNVCINMKVIGVHVDGGMAEEIIVPAANAYRLPESMDFNRAVMVEPFSIGANVCERTSVGPGDRVLVVGAGVIGNTAAAAAGIRGAHVTVCDIDNKKLEQSLKFGADAAFNSNEVSLSAGIAKATGGLGATVVIDAACVPGMFQSLLECAEPGGRIGILGFAKEFSSINQFEITRKELTVCGSRLNNRRFNQVIEWFGAGLIRPEELIGSIYDFSDAPAVLRELAAAGSNNGKTVIRI